MEKMRMETLDMVSENIKKIENLFPNCITETVDENGKPKKAINFELLRQILSGDVLEGDEAYEFTWVGKKAAIVEANKSIRKTLRPCPEESVNWDTTENLYSQELLSSASSSRSRTFSGARTDMGVSISPSISRMMLPSLTRFGISEKLLSGSTGISRRIATSAHRPQRRL